MKLRVVFYAAREHRFDIGISTALGPGVRSCGDDYAILPIDDYDGVPHSKVDVAVFAGVKNKSKLVYDSHRAVGKHTVVFDKGYTRLHGGALGTLYWRVAVNEFQPHTALARKHRSDRWDAIGQTITPCRQNDKGRVLFCGGSQKYCNWHNLGDANEYARAVLDGARRRTLRRLVYRPKPSWRGAQQLSDYYFSGAERKFVVELESTYQTITFGSNASFESLLRGVPTMVLGDGVARRLARTDLDDIENPLYPSVDEVYKLGCAVAYCQWTLAELESGEAWRHMRHIALGEF